MNVLTPPRRAKPGANILDRHKRAARMLGFALASDFPDTWRSFATVIGVRLDRRERMALALMALETLDDAARTAVTDKALRRAGPPPVPLFLEDEVANARLWTVGASQTEIEAYALATFNALTGQARREFLDYANRGVRT